MSIQYRTQDPSTGELIQTFETMSNANVEQVLEAASTAFKDWSKTPVGERARIVRSVADVVSQKHGKLARIISQEMGKPIDEAKEEVEFFAEIFTYFADNGPTQMEDQPLVAAGGGNAMLQRRPLGVLLGVMPWNYPYYQVARFVAPNLIAGNTILLKHAELCAASAQAIAEVLSEAGVPEGVYQNLYATHDQVATMIADPRVQGISLTGSERAGAEIAKEAGRNLKKVVLELGGSDPYVILSSSDPRQAARDALAIRFSNTGQACNSNKRMIVMEDIYDEFVDELVEYTKQLKPGDPQAPQGQRYYPLSSEQAADTLMSQLKNAVDSGAELLVGGERANMPGYYVSPAVLTNVGPKSDAYYEELFGPVATVFKVSSDEEALKLANDTPFGLGAAVYATDVERAATFADGFEAGMIGVNAQAPETADMPFGGVKRSGYGRELGPLGIDEFVNKRLFYINE